MIALGRDSAVGKLRGYCLLGISNLEALVEADMGGSNK